MLIIVFLRDYTTDQMVRFLLIGGREDRRPKSNTYFVFTFTICFYVDLNLFCVFEMGRLGRLNNQINMVSIIQEIIQYRPKEYI